MIPEHQAPREHKSLIHSITEIVIGRVSVAVFSLLFLAYFARELPKPVLGLIGVHATIVALTRIVVNLGLHFQVVREGTLLLDQHRTQEAIHEIIAPATLIRVIATIAIVGMLLLLGYVFLKELQSAVPEIDMSIVLPFACIHILFKNTQYIFGPIFHAQQRYWLDSVLDSGSATSEKIFALIFYLLMGTDYFFAGMMMGEAVTLFLAAWCLRDVVKQIRPRDLSFGDAIHRLRKYFPHYQRTVYRRGLGLFDRVIIAALLPLSGMANYHVARQGAGILTSLTSIMTDPLMVRLSANLGMKSEYRDQRLYYALMIGVSLLLAFLSPWLIQAIGGDRYADAWMIMSLLAIGFLFNGLAEYQLSVIVALSKHKIPVRWEAAAGVVGIATTILMINLLGELGAPLGQLANYVLLYLIGRTMVHHILVDRYGE